MTPWIKRSLMGLAALGLVVGGLSACSHRLHHGPMTEADAAQWRERMVERAGSRLDLDQAQKARLNALADALALQRKALMGEGGTHPRAEFQALIAGTNFDRARAQSLLESKSGAVQSHAPKVITAAADFYDSLKPEQQQKLRDMMSRGRRFGG